MQVPPFSKSGKSCVLRGDGDYDQKTLIGGNPIHFEALILLIFGFIKGFSLHTFNIGILTNLQIGSSIESTMNEISLVKKDWKHNSRKSLMRN